VVGGLRGGIVGEDRLVVGVGTQFDFNFLLLDHGFPLPFEQLGSLDYISRVDLELHSPRGWYHLFERLLRLLFESILAFGQLFLQLFNSLLQTGVFFLLILIPFLFSFQFNLQFSAPFLLLIELALQSLISLIFLSQLLIHDHFLSLYFVVFLGLQRPHPFVVVVQNLLLLLLELLNH